MIVDAPCSLTPRSLRRLRRMIASDYVALAVAASQYPADAILRIHSSSCDTYRDGDCDCRPLVFRNGGSA